MMMWFRTLNEALEAEGLLNTWEIHFRGIGYGQTFVYHSEGRRISIYRSDTGLYERPVHYKM